MKISIKTPLVTLTIEDETLLGKDDYTKHKLPELPAAVKSAVDEAIRLHNDIATTTQPV